MILGDMDDVVKDYIKQLRAAGGVTVHAESNATRMQLKQISTKHSTTVKLLLEIKSTFPAVLHENFFLLCKQCDYHTVFVVKIIV